ERSVFKVKVTSPKVSGGYDSGGIAGKPAPGIESGDELELAVVPEGSVLRRTVIKASKGGGLDNSGTREGFARAVAAIPRDRPVVLSFEKNGAGEPEYVLRMVQIRMTPEEVAQRLRELGLDGAADAVGGGECRRPHCRHVRPRRGGWAPSCHVGSFPTHSPASTLRRGPRRRAARAPFVPSRPLDAPGAGSRARPR